MTPVIDIHIHVQPPRMLKPAVLEFVKRTYHDFARLEKFSSDPLAFLNFLDAAGVERAGLVTSVSPEVIGHTAEVNDWNARYCAAAPDRLIAFGSVHPDYVSNAAAEVDRLASIGIRALKVHPRDSSPLESRSSAAFSCGTASHDDLQLFLAHFTI